jgi:uncharacterized membrane protein
MRWTRDRHVRLVLGAATWAAIFSVFLAGFEKLDLDAVVPWPDVTGVNDTGRSWAIAIVLSLPIIALIPLPFRDKRAVRVSAICSALILGFVVITLNRNGVFYIPSAFMLGLAAQGVFDRKPNPGPLSVTREGTTDQGTPP